MRTIERVAQEVDSATADRVAETVRRIFGRVLRELADLDNPMRTATGSEPGEGALFEPQPHSGNGDGRGEPAGDGKRPEMPSLTDYLSTLAAKEYVVYNNPRADPAELGEEMVRIVVRVRRHMPASK